jgi:hypothetical protein
MKAVFSLLLLFVGVVFNGCYVAPSESVDLTDLGYDQITLCATVLKAGNSFNGKTAQFTLGFTSEGSPGKFVASTALDANGRGCITSNTTDIMGYFHFVIPDKLRLLSLSVEVDGVTVGGSATKFELLPECEPTSTRGRSREICHGTILLQSLFDYDRPFNGELMQID